MFEVAPPMGETAWQKVIEEGLDRFGYWYAHMNKAFVDGRVITPTSRPGFPDLVAFGPRGNLAIEVKGYKTAIAAEQIVCLEAFAAGGGHAWILRPNSVDWNLLVEWIRDPTCAPVRFGWTPEQYEKALAAVSLAAATKQARRPRRR